MHDVEVLCEEHKSHGWIQEQVDGEDSTPGEEFQGRGRSAASSVGRSKLDSRRGVLRGVGAGAVPGKSETRRDRTT